MSWHRCISATPGKGLGPISAVIEPYGAKRSVDAMEPELRISLRFPADEWVTRPTQPSRRARSHLPREHGDAVQVP